MALLLFDGIVSLFFPPLQEPSCLVLFASRACSVLGAQKNTSAPPGDPSPSAAADRFAAQTIGGFAAVNVDMY